MAVITGWSNLAIIDFDNWDIWKLWKSFIINKYPDFFKSTYLVRTRRGVHVYLFINDAPDRTMTIKTNEKNPKKRKTLIDIKAAGGYCLVPNSIHPSGHQYRAINDKLTIATIDHLSDVMPRMLLDSARQDVIIPECTKTVSFNGEIDVWNVTPQSQNGSGSIDWIKQNRSILEFFPNARQTGQGWYMVYCPVHGDNHESASINTVSGRIKCFKGCFGDRGADVIDFYCVIKKCDRKQAVRELYK
jgi:hypothetical protein